MILCLKTRESRSPPGLPIARYLAQSSTQNQNQNAPSVKNRRGRSAFRDIQRRPWKGRAERLKHRAVPVELPPSTGNSLRKQRRRTEPRTKLWPAPETPLTSRRCQRSQPTSPALQSTPHQSRNPSVNLGRPQPALRLRIQTGRRRLHGLRRWCGPDRQSLECTSTGFGRPGRRLGQCRFRWRCSRTGRACRKRPA